LSTASAGRSSYACCGDSADHNISSLELAPAYEKAKLDQEKAAEAANANHAKKRSMLTEAKHFKEQTAEVKQWEQLRDNKVGSADLFATDLPRI